MEMMTEILGPLGPVIIAGVLGLVMIAVTVILMLRQPEDPLSKLKKSSALQAGTATAGGGAKLRQGGHNEQLDRFAGFLEPQDVAELSKRQLLMTQAGYQSKDAVRIFHVAQMGLAILGLVAGVFYVNVLNADVEMEMKDILMYTLGPGGVGYYLPQYWITKRVAKRKDEITRGFPDALDMMLVCVEAGQSMEQSIIRVANELHASYPALANEFEVVAHEMKAGKDKDTVLNDMGERCGVPDVASFATVLVQSTSFGTSIGEALRVYAGEMRDKRVMRAEEAANKLPTKMTLATMMLTVPPLLIILVGPSVHGITELGNMGSR
ncbi:MAG: type II secretion system F family protein [Pseudomonadota bacterium]